MGDTLCAISRISVLDFRGTSEREERSAVRQQNTGSPHSGEGNTIVAPTREQQGIIDAYPRRDAGFGHIAPIVYQPHYLLGSGGRRLGI